MRKKAQTEIMGLLTIVVLFIFIGLIYVMLTGKEEPGSLARDVVQYEQVENFLDAFVQLTPCYVETPYPQMETIIKDCYASEGMDTVCGKPCKDFINEEFENVMTAYNPKQAYEFKILKGKEEFISQNNPSEGCPETAETRAGSIVLSRELTLRLTYCIK